MSDGIPPFTFLMTELDLDANSEVPFNGPQRTNLQRQTRNQPNQTGHRKVQIVDSQRMQFGGSGE
jgi:hypothetical protein